MIASEYAGGISRYPRVVVPASPPREADLESPAPKRRRLEGDEKVSKEKGGTSRPAIPTSTSPCAKGQVLSVADITLPTALTREMVRSVPLAGIGIDANGDFGLLPDKENTNIHKRVFSPSELSVSSSMEPQGLKSPSVSSDRAEAGSSPKIKASTNQRHDTMPDALPTPPSEKPSIPRCETEFGIDVDSNVFGNYSSDDQCEKEYLNSPEEILFMQEFVEFVSIWMDLLDKHKHFSQVLPFLALRSPMLLNAFLACGVKYPMLASQTCDDEKARCYYNTATTQLLLNLQNPDRNIEECATTAVILNMYELMSEKPNGRMCHIAGARALIRECGWNARSEGIGSACFWINIQLEMIGCLAFKWPLAWDPDQWGLDLSFVNDLASCRDGDGSRGQQHCRRNTIVSDYDEELWVQRIFYILAKVVNFRANHALSPAASTQDEQVHLHNRFSEWKKLKDLCNGWNHGCPRSMKPLSYLYPSQNTVSSSVFPQVWLLKQAAVIGRLLYHTAMILLHQTNPLRAPSSHDNQKAQIQHARQVCGIVAHMKAHRIISVVTRSLIISAIVLQDKREQDEVVSLLQKMTSETGWCLDKALQEIYEAWGRDNKGQNSVNPANPMNSAKPVPSPHSHFQMSPVNDGGATAGFDNLWMYSTASVAPTMAPPAHSLRNVFPVPSRLQCMANPFFGADFNLPDHPYKAFYRPPSEATMLNTQAF